MEFYKIMLWFILLVYWMFFIFVLRKIKKNKSFEIFDDKLLCIYVSWCMWLIMSLCMCECLCYFSIYEICKLIEICFFDEYLLKIFRRVFCLGEVNICVVIG